MRTLNLGILAHVDAGKTSLTERLLHDAGVTAELGRVDAGSTATDTLALERQRGITIRSAVVSFVVADTTVNLIDTPGHPDFIAEVERVLAVLDGAVLVVSAVEGVQAQTRVLFRTLCRLRIPTLILVNKIDRTGARYAGALTDIAERLNSAIVPLSRVTDLGTKNAQVTPCEPALETLAEHDDDVLAAYLAGTPVDPSPALAAQVADGRLHPVYFGSAITGAGMSDLITGITTLLPAATGDPAASPAAMVFKVDRGTHGEKVAYVRMFAGAVHVRDRWDGAKITAISVFDGGAAVPRPQAMAGQIATLRGLSGVRIGDALGNAPRPAAAFAPPTLETVVVPRRPADRGALHAALTELAEQDPLIDVRQSRDDLTVSVYGEVQKEIIEATLATDYGLAVTFRESTVVCVERLAGPGEACEMIGAAPNPFFATIGLRLEPGTGVSFRLGVELGSLPLAFFTAVEDTVRATLQQALHGWPAVDCTVTMTRSGYASPISTAADFRHLTPLVTAEALRRAGTVVCQPVHALRLEIPADTLAPVLSALARVGAVPLATTASGTVSIVDGEVPSAHVHTLQQRLPALTRGEGVLETAFDRYAPVAGPPPSRPRTDHNPLNRKQYMQHVLRRT